MFEIIPNWHPIFVHFTVSALSLSAIFFVLSYVFKKHAQYLNIRMFAEWNLWIGCIFSIATAIAGWIAYNTVAHDTPSHEAMTIHRNWALGTISVFIFLAVWLFYIKRKLQNIHVSFIFIMVVAFGMLGSTAWRGGEAVYRYGLGVMFLPKVEVSKNSENGDGHNHEHAGEQSHGTKHQTLEMPTIEKTTDKMLSNQDAEDSHENHNH